MKETRKLNTILLADIAGYTAMMQDDEARAMELLQIFKKILGQHVAKFEGHIVQYFGDACILSFDSTTLGVQCAISLQVEFRENDLPIRIGMHLGEVVFTENNVFGDGVNIASRIESMGIPNSVLISGSIRNQIKNKNEFSLKSLGSFEFKNVNEPLEVFALENNGLSVPERSKMVGKFKEQSRKPKGLLKFAGVLAMLIAAFFLFNYFTGNEATAKENSIAVLPLINLNNTDEFEYFSDGVTQEIIDELAKISSITVSAFTSTYQYKNQTKPQREIAEELGVKYLIAGSYRLFEEDKRIRLSLELIDPFTKERIWNNTLNEEMNNAQMIQLSVARKVAENLNIELTSAEKNDLENPSTKNGEAFRLYLQAKSEINKLSPEGLENGTRFLEEAIKLDQNFSQAHTLLAWRYTVGASADFVPGIKRSTSESVALAMPYIEKALENDPEGSDIFLVRANLKLYSQNKIENAKEDVERAFRISSWPRIPTNYCICTAVSAFIASRELDRAKEIAEQAKDIDPGHVLYDWDLGNIAMKEGDYLRAKFYYGLSVAKADIPFFNTFLGWSLYYNEQYEEALKYLTKAYDNSPLAARWNVASLSNTYFKMGDKENADKYLQELLDRSSSGEPHLNLFIADILLERNEKNRALDYLEQGVSNSDFGFAVFLSLIPKFKTLQNEPRFQEILTKIQSPGI
jgi:TolB-like protein/class 3 adenylate cyclase